MILDSLNLDKPCKKQTVVAILETEDKKRVYIGSNWCEAPQEICPRKDMPSGVGYHLCKDICEQPAHAEVDALKKAGNDAINSTIYVIGHTYFCEDCIKQMKEAKVKKWIIL